MQTHSELVHSFPPRVFAHSLDWRFLLPAANLNQLLVAFEADADFSQTLEQVGIPVANQITVSKARQAGGTGAHSVALPFGLPVRWVGRGEGDQIDFLTSLKQWIGPTGYLLIGFNGSWNLNAGWQPRYHSSTPQRVARQLHRAGFASVRIFGAMPDLSIPEYIFDLDPQAIHFALRHRFRRKPLMASALEMVSRVPGLAPFSSLLPCYFAVAGV